MNRLPESLERFGREYAVAIRRDERAAAARRPRRRRRALAVAASATGLAVVVLTLQAVAPADRSARLAAPVAASASERAKAALAASPGTILHVVTDIQTVHVDGRISRRRDETWQDTLPPYGRRQVTRAPDGRRAEVTTVGGQDAIYDAARDTIYVEPPNSQTAPLGVPEPAAPEPDRTTRASTGEPLVDQVLALLDEGRARMAGRSTVRGQAAVRLVWTDGHADYAYLVDAESYAPLEWRIQDADGSTTTVTFRAYERLPRTIDTQALLDLVAQYPDARVVRTAAEYRAAHGRLARP